jgi:hypothetical protein
MYLSTASWKKILLAFHGIRNFFVIKTFTNKVWNDSNAVQILGMCASSCTC